MEKENIRNWEKGIAEPIPGDMRSRFVTKLEEINPKYKERNRTLFFLGITTGFRLQDLIDLTVGEIRSFIEMEEIKIQEKKQYRHWLTIRNKYPSIKKPDKRSVKIYYEMKMILKEYIKDKKDSDFAFSSNKKKYISQQGYSHILTEVGKEIGLKNITGHSLRKTFATIAYKENGYDIEATRAALGHKSIEETKRYIGVKEKMRERSILRVAQAIFN